MILLVFVVFAAVLVLGVLYPEALEGKRRSTPEGLYDPPRKGDWVVIIRTDRLSVISKTHGEVAWAETMSEYVGSVALVESVESAVRVCKLSVDQQHHDWHFSWLVRIPDPPKHLRS